MLLSEFIASAVPGAPVTIDWVPTNSAGDEQTPRTSTGTVWSVTRSCNRLDHPESCYYTGVALRGAGHAIHMDEIRRVNGVVITRDNGCEIAYNAWQDAHAANFLSRG